MEVTDFKIQIAMSTESPESDEPEKNLPQPLHKPQSLFVRSLTPLITREDLLHVVKSLNLPGFLRLAMAEPLPDRKYVPFSPSQFQNYCNFLFFQTC